MALCLGDARACPGVFLYRHAVRQTAQLPDAFAGPTPSETLAGEDRWADNFRLWWCLLDVVQQKVPVEKRQAAFKYLVAELTGHLVCGLPQARYWAFVEGRLQAGPAGKGSRSKGQVKVRPPGKGTGSQSKGSTSEGKGAKGGHGQGAAAPGEAARAEAARTAARLLVAAAAAKAAPAGAAAGTTLEGSQSAAASSSPGGGRKGPQKKQRGSGKGTGNALPDARRSGKGSGGSRGGGKPPALLTPPARPRTRSPRGVAPAPRGTIRTNIVVQPWRSAPPSAPPSAPRSRSPVSGRRGTGRGPAPSSALRLRSPVVRRASGGRGPATSEHARGEEEGPRWEGSAVLFTAGSDVEANRRQFLQEYCDMPPGLFEEEWAALRHESGWTPLHFLAQAVNRGHLLAPAGCRRRGLELLGSAESLVRLLRERGCDLDCAVSQTASAARGFTALHLLAKPYKKWSRDQLEDVLAPAEAILQQGGIADPEVPHSGRTPLAIAASAGQEELALLLVRYGADPAACERDGPTPIEICRRGRQLAMASRLEEERSRRSSFDPAAAPRARR